MMIEDDEGQGRMGVVRGMVVIGRWVERNGTRYLLGPARQSRAQPAMTQGQTHLMYRDCRSKESG